MGSKLTHVASAVPRKSERQPDHNRSSRGDRGKTRMVIVPTKSNPVEGIDDGYTDTKTIDDRSLK